MNTIKIIQGLKDIYLMLQINGQNHIGNVIYVIDRARRRKIYYMLRIAQKEGWLAQWIEQKTHNLPVESSNLSPST